MCAWFKNDKNRYLKYGITGILLAGGILLLILDYRTSANEIQKGILRNSYGEGGKTEAISIKIDGNEKTELDIQISEQKYADEEVDAFFKECISQLEKEMLGENKSPDYVTQNLNLMTELSGRPVEIDWKVENYEVINIYGEIQEEGLKESGTMVNLEAVLTYTENPECQAMFECMIVVYPPKLTEEEQFLRDVKAEIEKKDKESQTKKELELPKVLHGRELQYYKQMDFRGLVLIVMAILIGGLFYVQEMQKQGEKQKERQKQMMKDYPEIISKLTLFLGTGMTMNRAWRKVVSDYEREKEIWGIRYAYEEMKMTCREMESGITEAESYERFGKRCNIQEYIRLGALLSQNIRKGTKGLNHILRLEASQAFENRKTAVRKYGEEAGTRLLLPMFIMFVVVLVMVIVPAFLSLQM